MRRAQSSVQLYNFCKCVFSFGVPFYLVGWTDLPGWEMGGSGSFTASYVAQAVIVTVLGLAFIALLIPMGRKIREKQGLPLL